MNLKGGRLLKPLVSIVMPVYNGELYLREALDSVVNQTYRNFELICVDDGSTDKSVDILKEYHCNDSRIVVLQQKNQYAGIARNNGMAQAKGKYLMFLDSDDVFEKNMLSVLVKRAERDNTDIIFFGFYQFKDDLRHRSMMGIPFSSRKVCSPDEHQEDIFRIAQGVPWNKFYNREFVMRTGLQFQGLQSNNDVFFSKAIVVEAKRLLFLNSRFVNYRISNKTSIQGSYNIASGNFVKCILSIYEELNKSGKYDFFKSTFERYVIDSFLLTFKKCHNIGDFKLACNFIREAMETMTMTVESPAISEDSVNSIFVSILSMQYEDALLYYNKYLLLNYVPKTSIEYRIGKKLLSIVHMKIY